MAAQQDLDTILAAWNTWKAESNAATTDQQVATAFKKFVTVGEAIAIANGHPPGIPKRKL